MHIDPVAVGANIEGAFIAAGRNSPGGSQMLSVCVKILPGNSSEENKAEPFLRVEHLELTAVLFLCLSNLGDTAATWFQTRKGACADHAVGRAKLPYLRANSLSG
jgi:hypothetical protein